MKRTEIEVGQLYDWGGYIVKVTSIESDGIVIECQEVGEEIVKPSKLKPLSYRSSEPTFYEG